MWSIIAVVPGIATLWLGLPFILAGGGLALALTARSDASTRQATAALLVAVLVLVAGIAAYARVAADKLGWG